MAVIVSDKYGRTDGVAYSFLQKINSPLPIVLVSRVENFEFNEELLNIKDYILVCFTEYCWDWDRADTHIWGVNTSEFKGRLTNGEWDKFDEWVNQNPPKLTFKRELLKKDAQDNLLPIEYPCVVDVPPIQSKQEYEARPINAFWYWGRSHEARLTLHSNIWKYAVEQGASVCDNIYYINAFLSEENNNNKWVTLNIPHYARLPIENIMQVNGASKVSFSLAGSGFKCFRHCEASSNSLMAIEKNDFAWTHEWNNSNSIQFRSGNEIQPVDSLLSAGDLYNRYVAGVENCIRYKVDNYTQHLEKAISSICEYSL